MPLSSPYVTPEEVIDYTEDEDLKKRPLSKIKFDIVRAESKVFSLCNQDFSSMDELPSPVKLSIILYAEYYALGAIKLKNINKYKSESYDDYSYQLSEDEIPEPDIYNLIEPYIITHNEKKRIGFSLRKL